ncbi:hypothetical protein [Trinickia sp.]|uniref:hypothetical protein n=1 Tax=Trinickia sp. TaxID=2571163 RepID=UPI003F8017CB
MKTTKSGYVSSFWPVALALALIVLAALHAYGNGGAPREPLAADQVTAELARTVSYGLIGTNAAPAASTARHTVTRAVSAPGASAEAS